MREDESERKMKATEGRQRRNSRERVFKHLTWPLCQKQLYRDCYGLRVNGGGYILKAVGQKAESRKLCQLEGL